MAALLALNLAAAQAASGLSVVAGTAVHKLNQCGSARASIYRQAWLKLQGYQPTTLHISPFKRLGARVGTANVAFDDHPNDKRSSDRIETGTVDSAFAWLNRSGLGGPVQVIR